MVSGESENSPGGFGVFAKAVRLPKASSPESAATRVARDSDFILLMSGAPDSVCPRVIGDLEF